MIPNTVLVFYILLGVFRYVSLEETYKTLKDLPDTIQELFSYNGLHQHILEKESVRHLSSSMEDLVILFETELKVVKLLNESDLVLRMPQKQRKVIAKYLTHFGRDVPELNDDSDSTKMEKFITHPINAFYLMKRTAVWLPKVKEMVVTAKQPALSNISSVLSEIHLPEAQDFISGATFGLVDLQFYHNLNISNLAQGIF